MRLSCGSCEFPFVSATPRCTVPKDPTEKGRIAKDRPVSVITLSTLSLDAQRQFDGATWLDKALASDTQSPVYDGGFGKEVMVALRQR